MTFADDAGEYSIFAKNQIGEASASATLLEEGRSSFNTLSTGCSLAQWLSFEVDPWYLQMLCLNRCLLLMSAEEYDAYMKQYDVTYKSEGVQEPTLVVSQYEMEQRRMTTPTSFVSETVLRVRVSPNLILCCL